MTNLEKLDKLHESVLLGIGESQLRDCVYELIEILKIKELEKGI